MTHGSCAGGSCPRGAPSPSFRPCTFGREFSKHSGRPLAITPEFMKPRLKLVRSSIGASYQFNEIYRAVIPIPALERGWLHSRKLAFAWDAERIFEKIKDQCWFSRYHRE